MILSIIHVATWYATYSELKTALLPVVFFFRKKNQIQNTLIQGKNFLNPTTSKLKNNNNNNK